MKKLYFLSIIFVITSCGGGGGGGSSATPIVSIPFSLTLGFVSFSINEDETYSGSIAATANESVTLQYTITSQPSQGSLTLSTNGDITYIPSSNYNGSDQFLYSVTAVEKSVTKNATVNITVNPVNDAPVMTITSFSNSNEFVLPDEQVSVGVNISDIDNDIETLTISANSLYGNPVASFNSDQSQVILDPSNINIGGLVDVNIVLSDGEGQSERTITFWNLKKITSIYEDNLTYTFFGNEKNNSRLFNYAFFNSSNRV